MTNKSSQQSELRIIVPCANRKSAPVAKRLHLADVKPGKDTAERVDEWLKRLKEDKSVSVPVRQLYQGEHWQAALSLLAELGGRTKGWVCSAGYGLVSLDEDRKLKPYSATFSRGRADSVTAEITSADAGHALTTWWKAITTHDLASEPKTIKQIAEEDNAAPLVVVGSRQYVLAMADDLRAAREALERPQLLAIVSAGLGSVPGLESSIVGCGARFQAAVNGSRLSLNVRIAKKLITGTLADNKEVDSETLNQLANEIEKELPELKSYDRKTMTDKEVKQFIRKKLEKDEKCTHSQLLRTLRDGGQACEQGRFRNLFKAAKSQATQGR